MGFECLFVVGFGWEHIEERYGYSQRGSSFQNPVGLTQRKLPGRVMSVWQCSAQVVCLLPHPTNYEMAYAEITYTNITQKRNKHKDERQMTKPSSQLQNTESRRRTNFPTFGHRTLLLPHFLTASHSVHTFSPRKLLFGSARRFHTYL